MPRLDLQELPPLLPCTCGAINGFVRLEELYTGLKGRVLRISCGSCKRFYDSADEWNEANKPTPLPATTFVCTIPLGAKVATAGAWLLIAHPDHKPKLVNIETGAAQELP